MKLKLITDHNYKLILNWRNKYYDSFRQKRRFSEEEHDKWYKQYKINLSQNKDLMFMIVVNKDYVGSLGLLNIDKKKKEAELGRVVINPDFVGHNYAKKAIRLVIKKARNMKLKRIYLDYLKNNKKAEYIYNQFGFKRYKEDKDSYYMELYL